MYYYYCFVFVFNLLHAQKPAEEIKEGRKTYPRDEKRKHSTETKMKKGNINALFMLYGNSKKNKKNVMFAMTNLQTEVVTFSMLVETKKDNFQILNTHA